MARLQKTKRVTRKGSKQLTDEERASQVASPTRSPSPTIQPGEIDELIMRDPATLTEAGIRSQAFTRQMKADDIKREERAKQRGNTSRPSGNDNNAAVPSRLSLSLSLSFSSVSLSISNGSGTAASLSFPDGRLVLPLCLALSALFMSSAFICCTIAIVRSEERREARVH